MLRHEQQSIRMALATLLHHLSGKVHAEYGALRGQKTARAREEGHWDEYEAPRRQAADRSGRAAGATRAGSEAHRGADGRRRSHGADPRSSCAADGGTRCGCPDDL